MSENEDTPTDKDQIDEVGEAPKLRLSLTARLARVIFALVWLGIIGHLLALGSDALLVESAKAKLNDKSMYPVMATLLGLMSVLWFLIPAVYGLLVRRWMGRDALYIAPLLAMAVIGAGYVFGLKFPPPVTENVYIALFSVAVASFIGALIGWALARRMSEVEEHFYY